MFKVIAEICFLVCFAVISGTAQAESAVDLTRLKDCSGKDDAESLKCFRSVTQEEATNGSARSIINRNMEISYITAGSGIRLGADQTYKAMLYEGQIFKNVSWDDGRIWHTNKHYWLDVPVRIVVRQLNIRSAPVRTPSFNPGLRVYWYSEGEKGDGSLDYPFDYYSFGLHHYSNGQQAVSYNPVDGTVNTIDGSFSTNYAELAWHRVWDAKGAWTRVAFRQQFYGTFDTLQKEQYPRRQVSAEYQTPVFGSKCLWWDCGYQFKLTEAYKQGYKYIVRNTLLGPAYDVPVKPGDRWQTKVELFAHPGNWTEMSWYVRYDYGYDYYNINFQHRINRIQVGLAGRAF